MSGITYRNFNEGCIGATHVRKGLPMQDSHASVEYKGYHIAVVSDGHGNRRHFRSDRGSRIACEVTVNCYKKLIDKWDEGKDIFETKVFDIDSLIMCVKQDICTDWKEAVHNDYLSEPWTAQEMEEQEKILVGDPLFKLKSGENYTIPYGCTLCAVFTAPFGWASIQIGDGAFVVIDSQHHYVWSMPPSQFNDGNKTFSLCANDPMMDFRHCLGYDKFLAAMVYSDGIEKVYANDSKEVISLIYGICNARVNNEDKFPAGLHSILNSITTKSSIGDDISIAGIINVDADGFIPQLTDKQKEIEIDNLKAKRDEINRTIEYNAQKLIELKKNRDASPEMKEQIQAIINRKTEDSAKLNALINDMLNDKDKTEQTVVKEEEILEEPVIVEKPFATVEELLDEAKKHQENNEINEQLECLKTAQMLAPNSIKVLRRLADFYSSVKPVEAMNILLRIITIKEKDESAHLDIAWLHMMDGQWNSAEKYLNAVYDNLDKTTNKYWRATAYKGVLLSQQGKKLEGKTMITKALKHRFKNYELFVDKFCKEAPKR